MEEVFSLNPAVISHRINLLIKLESGVKTGLPVVLCIGSDRVTGDALGPVTGHLLKNEFNPKAYIYGTLAEPVTALNLKETLSFIRMRHKNSLVIAVDSALGKTADIGKVRVISGGIFPGAGTGKKLPKAGDIAITATVAELSKSALYGVRLSFILELSKCVAAAINESFINAALLESELKGIVNA